MQAQQPTAPQSKRTTKAIGLNAQRYLLDGGDEDVKRLLAISELMAEPTRTALRRSGIQAGWKVIDCGCGPIGGLTVLADLVGPAGRVVGVDSSQPTVQRARAAVDALGLDNVEVVAGDVNELDAAALGGLFDLAFTRLFLLYQTDPARTLRQIAALLRPGGWVIAQEPLRIPPPRSFPHLDALATNWQLLHKLIEGFGAPADAVEDLPRSAAAAGLEVVRTGGFFNVDRPDLGFGLHAGTLAAARDPATAAGLAAGGQIDALVSELRAAASGSYQWVTSPFFLELTLRKPASISQTNPAPDRAETATRR
jgi:SAM-dependent methyltransferase